jgi:pimeloyl-ACP methyl ester carboxylesterase
MEKHANDIACVLDDAQVGRAVFAGVSIGGYILFEFWRRYRGRVAALALCCTRPQADTSEARKARLKSAGEVLERGTEWFADLMLPKLIGGTARDFRPDLVDGARRMVLKMSPLHISHVQQGIAARPDSVPMLKTINVPALLIIGEEDGIATPADGELMRQHIASSQLAIVPKAGHFAAWEQPEAVGKLLRQFVDGCH